jgi:hypothetical protein
MNEMEKFTVVNKITSKKRVEPVFAGDIPDRSQIDFIEIDSDPAGKILGRETYWRVKAKSRIAFWDGRLDGVVQSLFAVSMMPRFIDISLRFIGQTARQFIIRYLLNSLAKHPMRQFQFHDRFEFRGVDRVLDCGTFSQCCCPV